MGENWLQKKIMPRFEMHIMIAEKSEDKVEDNVVLFGTAVVEIKGKEVLNIAFQNKEADQDEVNSIMDLCTIGREIIH